MTKQAHPWTVAAIVALLAGSGWAQVTQRVSVNSRGVQGDFGSFSCQMSADGRYLAFASYASNLVPQDADGRCDVFIRDRQNGTTELVSVSSSGTHGNDDSLSPSISADGRYVAFASWASNLVPGDTNGIPDVFVRDRQAGTTECVSVASGAWQANPFFFSPWVSISADGRYVAFSTFATNILPGVTSTRPNVFLRDRRTSSIELVDADLAGRRGNGYSDYPSISADGRYVAFFSVASNLVSGDTNDAGDVFVRDRRNGMTERVSVATGGAQGDATGYLSSISADGRYVAFSSSASNLVAGDTNGSEDVFVRDRQSGTTERVSVATGGVQGNSDSFAPSISADGRSMVFSSGASNLVSGDTNGSFDAFVHDRQTGTTERVSISSGETQASDLSYGDSITPDGRFVTFVSWASNLVMGDTNGQLDVFVRDRIGGTSFTSLCDPGVGGVIGCPCSNPPSGPRSGCDNSSGTGGAVLSASGGTYLSSDSLMFTTEGEKPTALSILTQWTGTNATGAIFGMGVRCTSGAFKRLYTKHALAGSITAPDFAVSDEQVSVRSAALGDTIHAGESRWYVVLYRDPTVLGGCPSNSTFNATQTGQVSWSP